MVEPGPGYVSWQEQAATSCKEWDRFLQQVLVQRLDFDKFTDYAPLLHSRHPLGPTPIAELLLRPSPWNKYTLDPRIPLYMQTLLDLKFIDTPAILKALYRYSTCHDLADKQTPGQKQNAMASGSGSDKAPPKGQNDGKKEITRWQSSFSSEEIIFYRLTKAVSQGPAIKNSRDSLEVSTVMAQWMMLFTAASAAFPPEEDAMMGGTGDVRRDKSLQQSKDDMENSRAAFVMLLLGVCENHVVLEALSKPAAKGESW